MIARSTFVDKIKSEEFKYFGSNEKEISFVKGHLLFVINKRLISYRGNSRYSLYKDYYTIINSNNIEDVMQILKNFHRD